MAKTNQLHSVLPLTPPLIYFFLQLVAVAVNSTSSPAGFSLEFIHRDSIFSPSFPGNLTATQWLLRQAERSRSHIRRLQSSITKTPNVDDLIPRPAVAYHDFTYLVTVSVGTPASTYFLQLDTGSDLTWLQCRPCKTCHPQVNQIFDPDDSSTYNIMPFDDPLCTPPYLRQEDENRCTFEVTYADGENTEGTLARESFSFLSNNRPQRVITPNIVFGCAFESTASLFTGMIAGIFGMGGGDTSFAVQFLGDQIDKRFSYCLVGWPAAMTMNSYLRFGKDIPVGNRVQTVPFEQTDFPTVFYLKGLLDISIDGEHLHMPEGIFDREEDGSGGFIIDSGSYLSYFLPEAYEKLRHALVDYLAADNLQPAHPTDTYPVDLCYQLPDGYDTFASMTLHFGTAELRVHPRQLFNINDEARYFCLAVDKNPEINVLGAMQQVNYRFTYDLGNQLLAFSPEDCNAESGH